MKRLQIFVRNRGWYVAAGHEHKSAVFPRDFDDISADLLNLGGGLLQKDMDGSDVPPEAHLAEEHFLCLRDVHLLVEKDRGASGLGKELQTVGVNDAAAPGM